MCLVTKYPGPNVKAYSVPNRLRTEWRISVVAQVCKILQIMHAHSFVHNDLKTASVCIRMSEEGPKVTLINFGLTLIDGSFPRLMIDYNKRWLYAPEILNGQNPGPCSSLSDAYSVGNLLYHLLDGPQMPVILNRWFNKSQDVNPKNRSDLGSLCEALTEEKIRWRHLKHL
ncbi:probable myosin light chain kinase DDB_G0275057 [Penaeus japonicus]|uniref:probable myosin light chain kinase DDB_G0275057 n=1 Tax=Penaeus japonicus TaxID=27405 RepID=UPI001C7128D0|nr:probable myosin light chain kinase DDB_G0275057 [Penaeus japonicus]